MSSSRKHHPEDWEARHKRKKSSEKTYSISSDFRQSEQGFREDYRPSNERSSRRSEHSRSDVDPRPSTSSHRRTSIGEDALFTRRTPPLPRSRTRSGHFENVHSLEVNLRSSDHRLRHTSPHRMREERLPSLKRHFELEDRRKERSGASRRERPHFSEQLSQGRRSSEGNNFRDLSSRDGHRPRVVEDRKRHVDRRRKPFGHDEARGSRRGHPLGRSSRSRSPTSSKIHREAHLFDNLYASFIDKRQSEKRLKRQDGVEDISDDEAGLSDLELSDIDDEEGELLEQEDGEIDDLGDLPEFESDASHLSEKEESTGKASSAKELVLTKEEPEKTGAEETKIESLNQNESSIVEEPETKAEVPKVTLSANYIRENCKMTMLDGKAIQRWSEMHPTSVLHELCTKLDWPPPNLTLAFECGPPLGKMFIFKAVVNGTVYQPSIAVDNKKEAKANAAWYALQELGFVKKDIANPL